MESDKNLIFHAGDCSILFYSAFTWMSWSFVSLNHMHQLHVHIQKNNQTSPWEAPPPTGPKTVYEKIKTVLKVLFHFFCFSGDKNYFPHSSRGKTMQNPVTFDGFYFQTSLAWKSV